MYVCNMNNIPYLVKRDKFSLHVLMLTYSKEVFQVNLTYLCENKYIFNLLMSF